MKLYRFASPAPALWNLIKAVFLVGTFWVGLMAVCYKVARVGNNRPELIFFLVEPFKTVAYVPFALSALLGLWALLTVVFVGKGTPMPFDAPRKLVTRGPYGWVRNPLLVAAAVQGLAATIYTGVLVILPVVLFIVATCQLIEASLEKEDMERTFGRDYEAYRRSVRYWFPSRHRWVPHHRDPRPISFDELDAVRRKRATD